MTNMFAFNTLVWLKQPEYPWWPGMVLDPTSLEMKLPYGYDTCVLCLPSTSSSVAFANSTNRSEIIHFTPAKDDLLIQEGNQEAECASAIEEALSIYKQQEQQGKREYEESSTQLSKDRRAPAHARGERKRHVREKRTRDGSSEFRRRTRPRHDEEEAKSMHGSKADSRADRNENEDIYEREALCGPRHGTQEADAAYLESVLRGRRRPVSNATLETAQRHLERLRLREGERMSEAAEDELLDVLSPFTMISVTLEQLVRVKIGLAVGHFLSRDYPVRVVSLAAAILRFWFRQLPVSTQQRLSVQTQIEAASNDTTAGSEHDDARLGALGVQIEDCFTDAEVSETIRAPAAVARAIQDELGTVHDEDLRIATLQVMRSPQNGELRRALLSGRVSAQEFVKSVTVPEALARLMGQSTAVCSVESQREPISQDDNRIQYENFTSLYECPSCGVREAVVSEYSVHAHDNMAAILRCIKCGETWNSGG